MGDHKLPCREFLFGLHDKQVIVWLLDAEIRDESDPQTDPGEIDEQIVAGQFDLRNEIQMVLLEKSMQKFTGRAAFIQHQDRVFGELLIGKLLTFQLFKRFVRNEHIFECADLLDRRNIA